MPKLLDINPRIMIVDDDASIRLLYGKYLEDHGYTIVLEDSAERAIHRLICNEHYDLIITDITMAKMDGWAFLDYIRNDLKKDEVELPVIVISGMIKSVDLELDALGHKANHCFTKPIVPISKLLSKVNLLVGRFGEQI